jgi:hypothetical protein
VWWRLIERVEHERQRRRDEHRAPGLHARIATEYPDRRCDRAHPDAVVNTARPMRNIRRRPMRSASRPLVMSRRGEHDVVRVDDPLKRRDRRAVEVARDLGNAMLTTVASTNAMNTPSAATAGTVFGERRAGADGPCPAA